jgi:hypothetical protein
MKWLALLLLAGCVSPTAPEQICLDLTGTVVACPAHASCQVWGTVQADGSQSCWSGE